jgi:hypothetical protein
MRMAVVIVGVLFVLVVGVLVVGVLVVGMLVVVFVIGVIVRVPMFGAVFVLMRMRMRTFVLHGFGIQPSLRLLIPTLERPKPATSIIYLNLPFRDYPDLATATVTPKSSTSRLPALLIVRLGVPPLGYDHRKAL